MILTILKRKTWTPIVLRINATTKKRFEFTNLSTLESNNDIIEIDSIYYCDLLKNILITNFKYTYTYGENHEK